MNLTVVTLVTREFCQEVTEENPRESTEKEDKNTMESLSAVLTTEPEEAGMEMMSTVSSQHEAKALTEKPEMEPVQQSKQFYEMKAALTAMWLPAVVGDKKNLFLATSLSTLITKLLILLTSVIIFIPRLVQLDFLP